MINNVILNTIGIIVIVSILTIPLISSFNHDTEERQRNVEKCMVKTQLNGSGLTRAECFNLIYG